MSRTLVSLGIAFAFAPVVLAQSSQRALPPTFSWAYRVVEGGGVARMTFSGPGESGHTKIVYDFSRARRYTGQDGVIFGTTVGRKFVSGAISLPGKWEGTAQTSPPDVCGDAKGEGPGSLAFSGEPAEIVVFWGMSETADELCQYPRISEALGRKKFSREEPIGTFNRPSVSLGITRTFSFREKLYKGTYTFKATVVMKRVGTSVGG